MRSWNRSAALFAVLALASVSIYIPPAQSQESEPADDVSTPAVPASPDGPASGASRAERAAWLAQRVSAIIESKSATLSDARIGIAVVDPATGKTVFERDGNGNYSVASNTKLVTTAAALSILGPAFRYRTGAYTRGIDSEGVVNGDLYVRGRGDPTLGTFDLEQLASRVADAGVKRISGRISIDDTYFDDVNSPPRFDAQPAEQAAFRAPVGAVSLNFNSVAIVVRPSLSGSGRASVFVDPPNDYVIIKKSEVQTVSTGRERVRIDVKHSNGKMRIEVTGQVRSNKGIKRYRRRVDDPVAHFAAVFRKMLERRGVRVDDKRARRAEVPKKAKLLAVRTSPPMAEIVRGLGKYSNNFVAEMLLKTIGAESRDDRREPATWDDAHAAIDGFLTEQCGLDTGSFRCENGSGLFDSSEFTPLQMTRVLSVGLGDYRYGPELVSSLAIAGTDGTLRSRMRKTPAQGLVRAKTGTLSRVSALGGYAAIDGQRPLAFAIFCNDVPRKWAARRDARAVQNEVAEAIILYLQAAD
jgi:D-alanyl-D-alanine carboxypeptidase/D-alanyl-D-alanine-endopeptidase (penicillin-binding protein 4)